MVVVDNLRYVEEVVPTLEVCTLNISLTPSTRSEHSECPAIRELTRRDIEQYLIVTVVAYNILSRTAFFGFMGFGYNVYRASHRGRRYFRGSQTSLSLHSTGNVGKTCPVAPVYSAPFHIVYGHTVDHNGDIFRLEASHVYLRVAVSTAVFGGIDTGGRLQHFGKFGIADLLFDSLERYIRYGYRGLPLYRYLRSNGDVFQLDRVCL